jgi:hypothetical protein
VIELNVGGIHMTTLLSTLTKEPDTMLAAMFGGRHKVETDRDGRFFIDCNGSTFAYILDFLRFGIIPKEDKAAEVYELASYFCIESLKNELIAYNSVLSKKEIAVIKSGPYAEKYELVKAEVVKVLKRHHWYEDLQLEINNDKQTSCTYISNRRIVLDGRDSRSFIKCGPINVDGEIPGDFMCCLIKELLSLGFGLYIYDTSFTCTECEKKHRVNEILFSTYQLAIDGNYKDLRVLSKQTVKKSH